MKERPILFSAPMVRAILAGSKTQTRRALKVQPLDILPMKGDKAGREWIGLMQPPPEARGVMFRCKFGVPGDRLWVREAWRLAYPPTSFSNGIIFRADAGNACGMDEYSDRHRWKPSIHMRRSDSRILLEITAVRVERLSEISEADSYAEGVAALKGQFSGCYMAGNAMSGTTAKECYSRLWESINGAGSWAANPWVWAISFRRINP